MPTDIESHSLPAHVSICEQRYHNLDQRIQQIEQRIEKIEDMVCNIYQKLDQMAQTHHNRWDTAQVSTIGVLMAVCSYFMTKNLF